jgi:hypothetical protein
MCPTVFESIHGIQPTEKREAKPPTNMRDETQQGALLEEDMSARRRRRQMLSSRHIHDTMREKPKEG